MAHSTISLPQASWAIWRAVVAYLAVCGAAPRAAGVAAHHPRAARDSVHKGGRRWPARRVATPSPPPPRVAPRVAVLTWGRPPGPLLPRRPDTAGDEARGVNWRAVVHAVNRLEDALVDASPALAASADAGDLRTLGRGHRGVQAARSIAYRGLWATIATDRRDDPGRRQVRLDQAEAVLADIVRALAPALRRLEAAGVGGRGHGPAGGSARTVVAALGALENLL